jgi:hypothetical protein
MFSANVESKSAETGGDSTDVLHRSPTGLTGVQLHNESLGVQTSRTLERARVLAWFVRFNPLEPHHATALGARGVFHVIDKPMHRESKAQVSSSCPLFQI